jgi:hypothetical protein
MVLINREPIRADHSVIAALILLLAGGAVTVRAERDPGALIPKLLRISTMRR